MKTWTDTLRRKRRFIDLGGLKGKKRDSVYWWNGYEECLFKMDCETSENVDFPLTYAEWRRISNVQYFGPSVNVTFLSTPTTARGLIQDFIISQQGHP